jgi:hypothetical protein
VAETILNMTAANAVLKELYTDQVLQNMIYKDNPFLAMIPKNTDFGGKYKPIPIIISTSQGNSNTFATAQANISAGTLKSFLLTSTSDYAIAQIDNRTMLSAKTDKMSFIQTAKLLVDGAIRAATNRAAFALFGDGTGTIGLISDITSGVITLSSAQTVTQFEVNQVLACGTSSGGTQRAAKGYVISVNRGAGTVTVSTTLGGTAATPTGWTNTEYLTTDGDLNAKMSGLAAWLPTTAPTASDSFYGVNRFADVTRLGGVRYSGATTGETLEETIISASSLVAREGGRPNKLITNYTTYAALEKSLGSKVQYVTEEFVNNPVINFRGIKVSGANTTIDVFPDRSCQGTKGYLLQMDTWALEGLGDVPMILKYGDGLDMLRVYNADSSELRVGAYGNVACNAPGWNCNITFTV